MLPKGRPRILIGDDHALVAEAIKNLLVPEFDVIGIAGDGRALVQIAETLKPDVVLVDVGMPKLNGLDAAQRIRSACSSAKIIYVTMNGDPDVIAQAFENGASAYLLKTSAGCDLSKAIRTALNGERMTMPLGKSPASNTIVAVPSNGHAAARLTSRQRDVLQLLAEGLVMKEVAGVLNLTTRTVAFHKYRLMETLGLRNDAELIQFAVRKHLLFLEGSIELRAAGPNGGAKQKPSVTGAWRAAAKSAA